MATYDTDILLSVYHNAAERIVGNASQWASIPHPGSNKTIKGWEWNKRIWSSDFEFESVAFAPSIWDPNTTNIQTSLFQSGYGDNKDLLLLDILNLSINNSVFWAPKINHGYYYNYNYEWYLYSDAYITQFLDTTHENVDKLEIQLSHLPKPTIPITVVRYGFDRITRSYSKIRNYRHVVNFSESGAEYKLDTSVSPPKIIVNGLEILQVTDSTAIEDLELVGISAGTANQIFNTTYAPIDNSQTDLEVYTWITVNNPTQWTVVSPGSLSGAANQVAVDTDLGTLVFGDGINGNIPAQGARIGVFYRSGISIEYEPEKSIDYILATRPNSNINPVQSATQAGFIQIVNQSIAPASIVLKSNLLGSDPYLIDLGNNIGKITATVKASIGNTLEGQTVTFEILSPITGTFGGTNTTISAITQANGEATVLYNSPATASNIGKATNSLTDSSGDAVLTVSDIVNPENLTGLATYAVYKSDDILGINENDLTQHYTDYFTAEDIVKDSDGTAASKTYEEDFRSKNNLLQPTVYENGDLTTGKKTILFTQNEADIIHPNLGTAPGNIYSPLYPNNINNIGTESAPILELKYNGKYTELNNLLSNSVKSFFIIGDTITSIRAYVTNIQTGEIIYSNTIQVRVKVPNTINGNFFINALADIPANLLNKKQDISYINSNADISSTSSFLGLQAAYEEERLTPSETYVNWFMRTRSNDTRLLNELAVLTGDSDFTGLVNVAVTASEGAYEIPLGFRLRSTGITLASVLDQITFLEPNSGT